MISLHPVLTPHVKTISGSRLRQAADEFDENLSESKKYFPNNFSDDLKGIKGAQVHWHDLLSQAIPYRTITWSVRFFGMRTLESEGTSEAETKIEFLLIKFSHYVKWSFYRMQVT